MPTAKYGFCKILVVVDTHTKKFDAECLKAEKSSDIVKAFEKIYSRYLPLPKKFEFDAGSSFHGLVQDWCEAKGIRYRYAETNRHRQQGIVESKNKVLGAALYSFINEKELSNLRKEQAKYAHLDPSKIKVKLVTDWYISHEHFRAVVDYINEHTKAKVITEEISDTPLFKKEEELLSVGTLVRTLLDFPREIATNKKLHGKFRASDILWSYKISPIEFVALKPGQPVMYRVQGEKILRTRKQLQIIRNVAVANRGFA
jgi:hypothetical protein